MSGRSKDQGLIDDLVAWMEAPDPKTAKSNGGVRSHAPSSIPDETIIEKCRGAANATKFEALFDRGDVHAYHGGDDSVADLALAAILAYYTQDATSLSA